jgi:hypothetical protein
VELLDTYASKTTILWVKLSVGDVRNLTPKKFIEGNNFKENL